MEVRDPYISRAVTSLKAKGWISTVWVVKPNENEFGLLFVDGPLLTLILGAAKLDRSKAPEKKVNDLPTPPAQITNDPVPEMLMVKKSEFSTVGGEPSSAPKGLSSPPPMEHSLW